MRIGYGPTLGRWWIPWGESERSLVANYLGGGVCAAGRMGYSPCRICGRNNGNLELTDGTRL